MDRKGEKNHVLVSFSHDTNSVVEQLLQVFAMPLEYRCTMLLSVNVFHACNVRYSNDEQ